MNKAFYDQPLVGRKKAGFPGKKTSRIRALAAAASIKHGFIFFLVK
jgi:hypothetical protein